ncbi:glycosyltransferase [Clostridium sp. AM58-1XD]|uniref:glycosyltransferase n=1 Tax=Clostridium sp. AM58-1XD TaxID=2292307 RepID=UPI000E494BE3|nr:glycosyltransferase [Clostridium sp. AM58-1XD]RGY97628.1 glycosyltransferase [Clostridium sp. AM58-1XD]
MITISLCMIVKNEEDVLKRCLDSVKDLVEEIILVDTGSSDKTKEIAAEYTKRIYEIPWKDDFAWARNFSFSKAEMEYCMWMDADDIMTEENRRKFKELKGQLNGKTDVVMMKYAAASDENGKASFSYYRERIVKNRAGFIWEGRIHEVIVPRGNILYSDIEITHKKIKAQESGRNLRIYEKMIAEGEKLGARGMFYYGRELLYNGRTKEAAAALEQFMEDPDGWNENKIEACLNLADCYEADGKKDQALNALFRSFGLDVPRAEICCRIGDCFQNKQRWREAVYWYKKALEAHKNPESGGFVREECYDYLPEINLCVCYDRAGNHEEAYLHHKKAKELRPSAKEVQLNEAYFKTLFGSSE